MIPDSFSLKKIKNFRKPIGVSISTVKDCIVLPELNISSLHVVKNQVSYSWESLVSFIGQTEIDKRPNWITQKDYYADAKKILRKGDIILTGLYRTIGGVAYRPGIQESRV